MCAPLHSSCLLLASSCFANQVLPSAAVPHAPALQASLASMLALRDLLVQLAPAGAAASLLGAISAEAAAGGAGGDDGGGCGYATPLAAGGGALRQPTVAAPAWVPAATPTSRWQLSSSRLPQLGAAGDGPAAAGAAREGAAAHDARQAQQAQQQLPGIFFKAAAVIKEELVLCECLDGGMLAFGDMLRDACQQSAASFTLQVGMRGRTAALSVERVYPPCRACRPQPHSFGGRRLKAGGRGGGTHLARCPRGTLSEGISDP